MADRDYRSTNEKYVCPKKMKAFEVLYSSIQSDARACSGTSGLTTLRTVCNSCEHYLVNRIVREQEEDELRKIIEKSGSEQMPFD